MTIRTDFGFHLTIQDRARAIEESLEKALYAVAAGKSWHEIARQVRTIEQHLIKNLPKDTQIKVVGGVKEIIAHLPMHNNPASCFLRLFLGVYKGQYAVQSCINRLMALGLWSSI